MMVEYIKDNGRKENSMDMELILELMESNRKGNGPKARISH